MTTEQLKKIKIACQKTDFRSKLTTFIDGVQYVVDKKGVPLRTHLNTCIVTAYIH